MYMALHIAAEQIQDLWFPASQLGVANITADEFSSS